MVINATDTLPRVKPAAVTSSGKDINFSLKPFEVRAFTFELEPLVTSIENSFDNTVLKASVPFTVQVMQKKLIFHLLPSENVKKIAIMDMTGKTINQLSVNGKTALCHWDGKSTSGANVSSGVYIVTVKTDKRQTSEKLSLFR